MQSQYSIIYRHRRENRKKCTLTPLAKRPDFKFFTYPKSILPPLDGYFVLTLEGPPLSAEDSKLGLLLVDSGWRYVDRMLKVIPDHIPRRSLPPLFKTAYPRRQEDCKDPDAGLASIEALYAAYHLLGWNTAGLLDHYHWKEAFITKNKLT